MCVCLIASVFFFKQTTAYEMRISDWSSDVCSSDLGLRAGQDLAEAFLLERKIRQQQVVVDHDHVGVLCALARLDHEALVPERALAAKAVLGGGGGHRQQRRVVRQALEPGQVAHAGAPAPGDDALELRDLHARGKACLAFGAHERVAGQVVRAALERRLSYVPGIGVTVRVEPGGRSSIDKKTNNNTDHNCMLYEQ